MYINCLHAPQKGDKLLRTNRPCIRPAEDEVPVDKARKESRPHEKPRSAFAETYTRDSVPTDDWGFDRVRRDRALNYLGFSPIAAGGDYQSQRVFNALVETTWDYICATGISFPAPPTDRVARKAWLGNSLDAIRDRMNREGNLRSRFDVIYLIAVWFNANRGVGQPSHVSKRSHSS